jgi:adenylate cyclase
MGFMSSLSARLGLPARSARERPRVARLRRRTKPVALPGRWRKRARRLARGFGLGRALSLTLLLLLIPLRIWDPPPVEVLRLRVFDAFQAIQPRPALPQPPVVVVDIDEASMRAVGQWPWPRTVVADMVRRLTELGAVAIAFDVVFAEPDRLSPALIARTLRDLDAQTRAALERLPSNDDVLAGAMRASRVVLGQTAMMQAVPRERDTPATGVAIRGPDPSRFLASFPGLLRNVPVLEEAAIGRGLFTILPEQDGIVRRVPLVMRAEGVIVPTLTLELLRILTGSGAVMLKSDAAGMVSVVLPGFELPTNANGELWLHFGRHDPGRFISAASLLDGSVRPERVKNKIVLVGTSAIGLLDNKTTPTESSMPGVEIHAQVLESALTRSTLSSPNNSVVVELLVTIAGALAIIVFAPILGAFKLLVFGAVGAAALAATSWYRFSAQSVLLDATFPLAATFSIFATLVFTNYTREQLGRNRIRSAFSQYLSPALVEQLAQSPEKLKLGGEDRVMTIMFSDVRGFTTISESFKTDPQGLTALMNRFLTPLTNAILERRGTIDKYMGDAIMAFWNAPLDDPNHERDACAAALDMLERMKALNLVREAEANAAGGRYIPLDVGIGINTGRCVVGNMGSDLRFDYSVLGDTVNLASRLEGQSKYYGVKIVLGAATAAAATASGLYAVLEIDLIRVKGKIEPETVSTLVGGEQVLKTQQFAALRERHAEMLVAYRAQDWARAAQLSDGCRQDGELFGLAGLYALYAQRVAEFEANPPAEGWDGVFTATSK